MMHTYRHIINRHSNSHFACLLLSLLLLCLTACSSSDEIENGKAMPTQLYVYVYKPYTAVPTRAYTGDVNAVNPEDVIYQLQIWVYTHDTGNLISYFSSAESSALNTGDGYEVYQLTVDDDYAQTEAASREYVDVYVLANVSEANCNLTLDQTTTKSQLEAAVLKHATQDPFGLTTPVTAVPENLGLPMSGVLRNVPVAGTAPVLRLDNGNDGIATVSLVRAVSKLRFAFANQTNNESLVINSIMLNADMIPEEEYLFMADGAPYDKTTCHIKAESGYNTTTPELLAAAINDIPIIADPAIYAWSYDDTQTPQAYETLIDDAVAAGNLTQQLYYLRESDKQLQGTIKYQIGDDGEEQTATFRMVDENGFSRNHFWTVYAYQAQAKLQLVVAKVSPWRQTEHTYDFYNW